MSSKKSIPRTARLGFVLALVPGLASAQTATAQPAPAAAPAAQTQPAGGGTQPAPSGGGTETPGTQQKQPTVPAGGYSFGGGGGPKKPTAATGGIRIRRRAGAPIATLPGFEQLPDGGSRLFVDLSAQVQVEERRGASSITYVLKGAQITHRNNANALVTVHFNTPVFKARLVPSGDDLLFVIDLRDAKATAQYKMSAKGQGGILTVDFPKGDFLPRDQGPPPEQQQGAAPSDQQQQQN
jgi:hypothetical protein